MDDIRGRSFRFLSFEYLEWWDMKIMARSDDREVVEVVKPMLSTSKLGNSCKPRAFSSGFGEGEVPTSDVRNFPDVVSASTRSKGVCSPAVGVMHQCHLNHPLTFHFPQHGCTDDGLVVSSPISIADGAALNWK